MRKLLLLVALSSVAYAQPKKDKKPSAEQKEADRHFKSGVALFKEAKFKEALAEFERAYEIAPHPLVLYNIAGCHRELSSYGEAIKFYERFLKEGPGQVPKARLTAAQTELDGILARIARVTVVIQGPPYATLILDGAPLGTMPVPMPLVLSPGEHKLVARADGYKDAERTLRVASGDEAEISLTLSEAPKQEVGVAITGPTTVGTYVVDPKPKPKRFAIGAGFGTNLRAVADTGAPSLGLSVMIGSRLQLGVDGVFVAYAVMPSVRVRLAGDAIAVYAMAAVPIAFPPEEMGVKPDPFVAGAGGLGLRFRAMPMLTFHVEALASFAGSDHGTTFPTFIGGQLWF